MQELCCAEKRQDDNFLFLLEKLGLLTDLSTSSGDNLDVEYCLSCFDETTLVRRCIEAGCWV